MAESDNIKDLEQALIEAQRLELRLLADDLNNPVHKIIDFAAVSSKLYSDKTELKKMISELKLSLKRSLQNANVKGKILGKNAIKKFLDESEIRDRTQKSLRIINQINERQASRRVELAFLEFERDAGLLTADIEIFRKNAKIAGFTNKEILSQLVIAGKEKTGIAQGFAKRMKRLTVDAVRRERSSAEIDAYRIIAKPNEKWQWIAISSKPCPDCDARAGRVMTLRRWEIMGLPGSGRTICRRSCKCLL